MKENATVNIGDRVGGGGDIDARVPMTITTDHDNDLIL